MKLIKLSKIHEGKYLTYYAADYKIRGGKIKTYEFISRSKNLTIENFGKGQPQGVGMVPFSNDGNKILLQKEYRMATHNWVYNFPAGLIDKGETPEQTARRELFEETGVTLTKIDAVLPPSFASQGTSDELMVIVICHCDGDIKQSCYEDEEIIANWYTKDEVRKLLENKVYMSVRTQMFLWQWINYKNERGH